MTQILEIDYYLENKIQIITPLIPVRQICNPAIPFLGTYTTSVTATENAPPSSSLVDVFAFLIGITVLHEYVHYGDYNYNGDMWQYPREEGLLFENDVYGQSVWISNAEIILKNN